MKLTKDEVLKIYDRVFHYHFQQPHQINNILTVASEIQDAYKAKNAELRRDAEWHLIETAPKGDGVLISIGNSVIRAMFIPEFTLEDNGNYLGDSSYKEENDTYYWPEGWYEWNDHEDTHWLVDEQPTHWMPLPKPPGMKESK